MSRRNIAILVVTVLIMLGAVFAHLILRSQVCQISQDLNDLKTFVFMDAFPPKDLIDDRQ